MEKYEVLDVIREIEYKGWELEFDGKTGDSIYHIRWVFTDSNETQRGRWWVIDPSQPHSDIVRTALAAAIMAEEHEVREKFKYRGKKVFNPHYDIDRLAEISNKLENLEIPETV